MQTMTSCAACGANLADDAQYCQRCATNREDPNTRPLFVVDGMTGLFNQTFTQALVDHETSRAIRYKRPLTILMADIDHREFVHRDLGPAGAAELYRELAGVLATAVRDIDTVGFMGDAFCIVLPETDQTGAMVAADKILHAVALFQFNQPGNWARLTISAGAASVNFERMGKQDLAGAAHQALLAGINEGNNRVHINHQM